MKPGSIVVVKPFGVSLGIYHFSDGETVIIEWLPVQDEETHYMIREIIDDCGDGRPSCFFEEGIIGWGKDGGELALDLEYVREVLPPQEMSVDEIIEKELLFEKMMDRAVKEYELA